ncbi:MAG: hypothetical protein QOK05_2029 [Chloroflexota bacterium]|jgi:acyl dehydratase|nr:hypothetical protein [Chloroflexota bacterium]
MTVPEALDAAAAEIGASGPAFKWVVERGKVFEFRRACLDDQPPSESEMIFAPPTFPQVATNFWEPPGSRRGVRVPFDPARVLHGEQEFKYQRPLRAGDVLTGQTRLVRYYEREGRRGGTMRFAAYETEFVDDAGNLVATSRTTMIETSRAAAENV